MPNRIYTQADYDRVTDMYNTYQNTKDRYTPEQQQQIESMFGKARNEVSNRIEDSNSRTSNFVDPSVLHDAQVNGYTREQMDAKWGPGAADLAGVTKTAPTRTVTPRNTVPPIDNTQSQKPNVSWDIDKYGVVGPQNEDSVPNTTQQDEEIVQNTVPQVPWDIDKYGVVGPQDGDSTIEQAPSTTNNNTTSPLTNFVRNVRSAPTRIEGTIDTLKSTPQFANNLGNNINYYNQMTDWNGVSGIRDNIRGTANFVGSIPGTLGSANNMLQGINKMTNNKLTTDAIRRLLNKGYRMGSDGTIYYPDGSVFTKL